MDKKTNFTGLLMYKKLIVITVVWSWYHSAYSSMIHLYTKINKTPSIQHIPVPILPVLNLADQSKSVCKNKAILKDREDFCDAMATFTYQNPLSCIDILRKNSPGNTSIIVLQSRPSYSPYASVDNNEIASDEHPTYILKTYPLGYPELPICEAVGSYIGSSLGISVHKTQIIPPRVPMSGKYIPDAISTLHTYMPGKEIKSLPNHAKNILVDSLTKKECFQAIVGDRDLRNIVMLDICTNNLDRNDENYRFDEKTNRYHAYDMDKSFNDRFSAASDSLDFLKKFLVNRNVTIVEKKTLLYIAKSLKHFLLNFPRGRLYSLWMKKAGEAEYTYSNADKMQIEENLDKHRSEIKNLLSFIEQFIT